MRLQVPPLKANAETVVAVGLSHRLSAADGRCGRPRADMNCASFNVWPSPALTNGVLVHQGTQSEETHQFDVRIDHGVSA